MGFRFLPNMRMMRIDAHPMRIGRCIRMANPNRNTVTVCAKQNKRDLRHCKDWKDLLYMIVGAASRAE